MSTSSSIHIEAETCIVTVVTDDFFAGGVVMLASLLKHHPDDTHPILILHHDERAPLTELHREVLEELSPRVRCIAAGDAEFWVARDRLARKLGTPARLTAAFLILEAFRITGPARVVTLDSDLLFLRSCRELFETTADFAAVRAFDGQGDLPKSFFNSGVMCIGSRHLTGTTYNDLLHSTTVAHLPPGTGMADQLLLNAYFGPARRSYLDPSLNVTKRHFPDRSGPIEEQFAATPTRVLHYVAAKPWQTRAEATEDTYMCAEALWHAAHVEAYEALSRGTRERLLSRGYSTTLELSKRALGEGLRSR
ncbi:glycosyltransferase [Demequina mangrovi]|uniref:Lipopolysaccharide biosynthesis protein, LPS:glycosyltransferase n=1 Tax=Demequina mangrovi TaxID=1043493 RepID=A0A1H6Z618_9MICO|nr:glycosyltransferase [Demequina mangrovi]SEJ48899.1 Lipopolysaccharide biosynthesis protein, LPS:glycosyltransferase [Demequina mangrovi]